MGRPYLYSENCHHVGWFSHREVRFPMILNKKDKEMNLVFNFKLHDFDFVLFVTSGTENVLAVEVIRSERVLRKFPLAINDRERRPEVTQ